MANPELAEKLDRFDQITVSLYRVGVSLSAFLSLVVSLYLLGVLPWAYIVADAYVPLLIATIACSASSLHLYDKRIRWLIAFSAWLGSVLWVIFIHFGAGLFWQSLALGFLYVTLSGIAIKESFCFSIVGLKFVPLLLALSLLPRIMVQPVLEGGLLGLASLLLVILSIAKWRMPLHFDIGDKTRYQV